MPTVERDISIGEAGDVVIYTSESRGTCLLENRHTDLSGR